MNAAAISTELLKRPDLPLVINSIELALREESTRRQEFRQWLDEDKKAEFINGEVVLHSPVKLRHLKVSQQLSLLLGVYVQRKKSGVVMIEKATIGLTRNDYEPDICFFNSEKAAQFTEDQMIFPAPDFVVEILSKSTAANDRGIKRIDYAAHGVREYWIIDPNRQTLEQFIRPGEDTEFMPANKLLPDQTVQSRAVEGFEIPVAALFDETACAQAMVALTNA
ncbi:MAG: Uma2 family endonuclease [Saprospiraceae bacterium]|jgi:Uma2 family endonuclease|nr:Uma2 family endonuclease [Saprospiraceae bacterium]